MARLFGLKDRYVKPLEHRLPIARRKEFFKEYDDSEPDEDSDARESKSRDKVLEVRKGAYCDLDESSDTSDESSDTSDESNSSVRESKRKIVAWTERVKQWKENSEETKKMKDEFWKVLKRIKSEEPVIKSDEVKRLFWNMVREQSEKYDTTVAAKRQQSLLKELEGPAVVPCNQPDPELEK